MCAFLLTFADGSNHRKAAGEKLPVDETDMARMQQTDVRLRGIANKM